MSGGYIHYAHLKEPEKLLEPVFQKELRRAAEAVEEGRWWTEEMGTDERAELVVELELMADTLEDARESVHEHLCTHDAERLLRSIDHAGAGDGGPGQVAEAWEEYSEGHL